MGRTNDGAFYSAILLHPHSDSSPSKGSSTLSKTLRKSRAPLSRHAHMHIYIQFCIQFEGVYASHMMHPWAQNQKSPVITTTFIIVMSNHTICNSCDTNLRIILLKCLICIIVGRFSRFCLGPSSIPTPSRWAYSFPRYQLPSLSVVNQSLPSL